MSEALQKVIAAMGAELARQSNWETDQEDFAAETGAGSEWRLDGRFDLEKVARAGLEAIREPTDLMGLGIGLLGPGSHSPRAIWMALMGEVLRGPAP